MAEKYQRLDYIDEGSQGTVFKAKNKKTRAIVAIKRIECDDEDGIPETALREIGLLKMLNSSGHSVRLLDVEHDNNYVHIVMEYVDTNLKMHIGVAYFHSLGVIHRDLKPANLLIEENEGNVTLKIADFGLSSAFSLPDTPYTDETVTLWYRAPEVLLGSVKFTGVDIWAVGCILAEMSSGQPLFPGGSEIQQLGHIFSLLGTPTEEEWPEVTNRLRVWGNEYPRCKPLNLTSAVPLLGPNGVDLLSKMLKYNPAERISARAALNHCYFAENNTSIEVLSKEDTCGNFEIAYKLLVNMSLESPSYEQVLKQPKFAETRERAFEKIESISNDQLFDSFTCSTAMYYIDILLSKFDLSDLEEPGFVNLWATVCYRTALKVVHKSQISFPELELFCSAPHDWNHLEIVLAKALNWNLCPATLHTLFYYLKEYLQLKFAYNKIGQHITDDDSVGGSASSGDSCLYDHTTRNADNDEMKVKSFVDSLILRVLSDTQFLQFQACDIAAALVFLLCDIPRSYTVIAVNLLTNKEKVKECEALLRTCFFLDE